MARVAYTTFFPEVFPYVPGAADIVVINAIKNSCIEFCSNTLFWQETQDAVDMISTDFPADLEGTSGARAVKLMSVSVEGIPINPIPMDEMDTQFTSWRTMTSTAPTYYYQESPYTFSLFPLPSISVSVQVRAAYTPLRTSTGIEEVVYQTHLETIAAGALGRLLMQPNQPWTNEALAGTSRAKFMQGIHNATVEANRSFGRSPRQVQMRAFA